SVNVRTARHWLHKLGCQYRDAKSGLYFDGHDREDVLQYRVEVYLPAYFEHRDYTDIWICATRAEAVKRLYPDGKKVKFCYQGECIYRSNDSERKSWVPPNVHGLKKKGDGTGIMISGTIVDNEGFIIGDEDDIKKAQELRRKRDNKFWTYYKFEYGKNKDGYWTGEKMVQHMADVLDLLVVKFPNYKSVCFFDWSSCQDCVEEGAPSVSRMNVGYGGVRRGANLAAQDAVTILEDTPKLKKGQKQNLTFQEGEVPFYDVDASDHVGKVKGLKQILFERGLLKPGMTKLGTKGDPESSMVAVLSAQLDFANVEPSLVKLVRRCGGFALMLPKFHCEINPIELVWGRSKHWIR
ncbi:unnamed protein product, partial [Pylaiella littoralis]